MAILEAPCAQNAPGRSTMRPPEALPPRNPTWESPHFSGIVSYAFERVFSISRPSVWVLDSYSGGTGKGGVRQHSVLRRVLRRFWKGFWERVLRRVLRRRPAMGFTVKRGYQKGSEKGVSRRCLERLLGEYTPLGVRPTDDIWSGTPKHVLRPLLTTVLRSDKLQNESSPNFLNLRPECCPEPRGPKDQKNSRFRSRLKISIENDIFERATHRGPIFCGEIETSRLKFSSEIK